MRLFTMLLISTTLISNYSYAATSPEITKLVDSAKQSNKNKNYSDAILSYEKAIKLGSPKASLYLSSMYKFGKGVTKDEKLADKYLQDAIKIYKQLANNDDVDAQYNLGSIYRYKTKPPRNNEAYNWYLKAANQGHKRAIRSLSTLKVVQPEPEKNKRVNTILWSTKENCFEEGAFMIAIENYGDAYKVAACVKHGCRIDINEFGRKTYNGNYKDDPKLIWVSDAAFETKINGKNMRFYHCLTK